MTSSPADAYYRAQLENPLTAFLDQVPRGESLQKAINKSLPPPPDATVREYPLSQRLRLNANLANFHVALGRDIDLGETILELIEQSYSSRNPTPRVVEDRVRIAGEIASGARRSSHANEAIGRALIGAPGCGKTRTVKRVLAQIPQVIANDLDRYPYLLPQTVTWIRVETPANRKLSALAENIIDAIGSAVGEDYSSLKRGNVSVKIQKAAMLCMDFSVGIIVIDEIQHILRRDKAPDLELVNFLVELSNRINVPLLLIGTPQAEYVAAAAVRQARRMLGPRWEPLMKGSEAWTTFATQLLKYQFTKIEAPPEELAEALWDVSQGLPAISVTVFQLAQRNALHIEAGTGKPNKTTAKMLNAAFDRYMRPVARIVDAMREGDTAKLAMLQDLQVDGAALDAYLVSQTQEDEMRNAQKMMRVVTGVTRPRGTGHKWRPDAN